MNDGETQSQEEEEDERTFLAAYRNTEASGLFRVYFMDATYLEFSGGVGRTLESDTRLCLEGR